MPTRREWDVEVYLGSETIRRRVSAEDDTKALRRVVMELSRTLNQQPAILFRKVYAGKPRVTPVQTTDMKSDASTTFLVRARSRLVAYTPSVEGDLDRISRLPLVESVRVYTKNGNEVVYRATMPTGVVMHQVRELTGQIQNLFGARLLSSGPTQEKGSSGAKRDVVEVRISLLGIVS